MMRRLWIATLLLSMGAVVAASTLPRRAPFRSSLAIAAAEPGSANARQASPAPSVAQAIATDKGAPAASDERPALLIADFEGDDYGSWTATGDAFGAAPPRGTLPNQQPVTGFQGKGLVNSYRGGDATVGKLVSPEFTIRRKHINFLLGGGRHPEKACVNLVVDGRAVRTATGDSDQAWHNEHMLWHTWDVADLDGSRVRIEIVDAVTGPWGHINVDHIEQSDERREVDYANVDVRSAMRGVLGAAERLADDPDRPVLHFLPPAQWNNDPNGTIYHNGYYHVFYQHNPYGDGWGHMHWGHARSRDLVHWEHLPIALWPSRDRGEDHCFSGCCVIADDGTPTIIYTSIGPERRAGDSAEQWGAVGDKDLITWHKHPGNPLLTDKLHGDKLKILDWRDPFVFKEDGKWYVVLGGHREGGKGCISLYSSDDLVKWKFLGIPFEGEEGNWECPNLFRLGDRWVLVYSPHSLVRYYVGKLDVAACKFTPEQHGVLDHSDHYYAPNCLKDDKGRRIMWGWVRGFPDGRGWNGCFTFPRVLSLDEEGRLRQEPAPELQAYRGAVAEGAKMDLVDATRTIPDLRGDMLEFVAEIDRGTAKSVGLKLRASDDGSRGIVIRYDGKNLNVDGASGPLPLTDDKPLKLHVLMDRSVVEVYANGQCWTRVIHPGESDLGVQFFAEGGAASLESITWWKL